MSYGIWDGDAKEMVDPEELRIRAARKIREAGEAKEDIEVAMEELEVARSIVTPVVPMDVAANEDDGGVAEATAS